jgi:hypothetical protein
MARIYRYQKVIDQFTTHCLQEPDYALLDTEDRITEICTIEGVTYVSVPAGLALPPQYDTAILVEEVELTDELVAALKAASPHVELINDRVVAKIRERYSVNDEIKMIRIGPTPETEAYNDYVEECRAWGRSEKAVLGL